MPMLTRHFGRLRRFAGVGSVGFLIEAGIVTGLTQWAGWTAWHARMPSFTTAVLVTWILNRNTTFKGRGSKNLLAEALMYFGTQAGGAAINLLIFGIALQILPRLQSVPVFALALGSIGGLVFNYVVAATLIYSTEQPRS